MTFSRAAKNFVILITVAIILLLVDLFKWQSGSLTWSESIWEVNQKTLGLALGVGIVVGHYFTVPRNDSTSK